MIALLPVVGVIVGGLITYLVARRTTSGKINTTEAATLWTESTKMREYLSGELVSVRSEMAEIERRCAEEIKALLGKITALEQRRA